MVPLSKRKKDLMTTQAIFVILYILIIFSSGDMSEKITPLIFVAIFNMVMILLELKGTKKVLDNADNSDLTTNEVMNIFSAKESDSCHTGTSIGSTEVRFGSEVKSDNGTQVSSAKKIPAAEFVGTRTERSRESSKVEVSGISTVENTSFSLAVEGRICGYIGNIESTFDVPSGMHSVQILTNDVQKKVIFEKNIMFNTKKRFTVKKKFGGYSVILE